MVQLRNTAHIWQHHKAIINDHVRIEAGCLDNPSVSIKGVRISEGPLYCHACHCNRYRAQGIRPPSQMLKRMKPDKLEEKNLFQKTANPSHYAFYNP